MTDLTEPLTPKRLAELLAAPVGEALLSRARVGSIEPFGADKQVEDQTFKFMVSSSEGKPIAVVLCSPCVSPDLIVRGSARAREAKNALGPELGRAVLTPIAEGEVRGLSYAVLPYCEPLSDKHFKGWLQRRRVGPKVLSWLHGVTRQTMRDVSHADVHARFHRPLWLLAEAIDATEPVRRAAEIGVRGLEQGRWTPRHVLMHNDLWKGNILLDAHGEVVVIDWPGSRMDGYAIYDLVRLADSFGIGDRALGEQIATHCRVLGCEPKDGLSHLAAALGLLLSDLDRFPMHLFLPMADKCVSRAISAVRKIGG